MSPSKPPALGSWARRGGDGAQVAEPCDERELIEVLHVLADRGVALNHGISLSRARLTHLDPIGVASMTVAAGAGVVLEDLETHLKPHGLSLGPLSPAAMSLQLGDFLEGPYAGLRSIPGGRLEPVCTSVTAITSDGRRLETSRSPRSAAGPDLSALVLGAAGRLALVTSGVVRCVPYPQRDLSLAYSFPSAQAFVSALQRSLAEGFLPWRVHVDSRAGRVLAEVRWAGSVGSVERDRELLGRCVEEGRGQGASELACESPSLLEYESTWAAVLASLAQGRALQLFRLSLTTLVARGDVEGVALNEPASWTSGGGRLLALDARGVLGGAP